MTKMQDLGAEEGLAMINALDTDPDMHRLFMDFARSVMLAGADTPPELLEKLRLIFMSGAFALLMTLSVKAMRENREADSHRVVWEWLGQVRRAVDAMRAAEAPVS